MYDRRVTRTLTLDDGRRDDDAPSLSRAPHLVLVLDAANPRARPALAAVDEVVLGRGSRRSRTRDDATLTIALPDPFLSSRHARLRRVEGAWLLEDARSKNGTYVEGRRLDGPRALLDGELVTLGSHHFTFRVSFPTRDGEPDVDLSATSASDVAFATLDAEAEHELRRTVRVALGPSPILVTGESGTGKELVARAIHAQGVSGGRRGAFVAINCGALAPTLVTSELFGVKKGAFSGATETRAGLVRSADGGTLFLDEIAELPLDAQAALLRVLQEHEVLAVGSERPVRVDVKVVAATHRDLEARVREGRFREDLFARIAGHRVSLRPLRQRREDLGLLIGTLVERHALSASTAFTAEAARALLRHDWPRNVRELEHALLSARAIAPENERIGLDHLPPELREDPSPTRAAVDEASFAQLARTHGGNVSAIARALGTSRSQVRRLAQRLGVELEALRE